MGTESRSEYLQKQQKKVTIFFITVIVTLALANLSVASYIASVCLAKEVGGEPWLTVCLGTGIGAALGGVGILALFFGWNVLRAMKELRKDAPAEQTCVPAQPQEESTDESWREITRRLSPEENASSQPVVTTLTLAKPAPEEAPAERESGLDFEVEYEITYIHTDEWIE
ncbi:MAG: hypothetical protein IJ960_09265 [Oscillospiraceae bacterium]|nr:hypothetical protein [Oscillospiraceae bacterium]